MEKIVKSLGLRPLLLATCELRTKRYTNAITRYEA
jgi:hypothetical protein